MDRSKILRHLEKWEEMDQDLLEQGESLYDDYSEE
jgi:hypothetical protein